MAALARPLIVITPHELNTVTRGLSLAGIQHTHVTNKDEAARCVRGGRVAIVQLQRSERVGSRTSLVRTLKALFESIRSRAGDLGVSGAPLIVLFDRKGRGRIQADIQEAIRQALVGGVFVPAEAPFIVRRVETLWQMALSTGTLRPIPDRMSAVSVVERAIESTGGSIVVADKLKDSLREHPFEVTFGEAYVEYLARLYFFIAGGERLENSYERTGVKLSSLLVGRERMSTLTGTVAGQPISATWVAGFSEIAFHISEYAAGDRLKRTGLVLLQVSTR